MREGGRCERRLMVLAGECVNVGPERRYAMRNILRLIECVNAVLNDHSRQDGVLP